MSRSLSIWHLLWRMIAYAPRLYSADTLFWVLISGLPALPGLVIRAFFNRLDPDSAHAMTSPWIYVALLLAIGVARIVAIFTGRVTKTQHRFTISALLRHNLLQQLLQRPGAEPFTIREQPVSMGQVLSFFREDADHIEDAVVGTNEILGTAIFAGVSLAILLRINLVFTLFVFVPLLAIALLIQLAEHRIKRYRRTSRQATQQVTGWIGELFTSVQAIQVSVAEAPVLAHFQVLNERRHQAMVRDQVFTSVINSSLENLVNLGTGLTLLIAAQSMAHGNVLSLGDFALFVYYLSFTTDFLWFLGGFLALTKQTEIAFERMGDLAAGSTARSRPDETAQAIAGLVYPAPLYLQDLRGRTPPLPNLPSLPPAADFPLEELQVVKLTYRYPNSDRGIENISFCLKRGSLTVITGPVGAGKTTLVRSLLGLLPVQSGEIYWNGQIVEHPSQFFVPPRSAYTPQVPQLFTGSLRDNLLLGRRVESGQLDQAIVRSVFEQDLAALPEGLETRIGVNGMRLSGGQRQRAAAARMLVHQPQLLVFDDLSSALDLNTELQLWSRLFADRPSTMGAESTPNWRPTCLVVSHQQALLQRADQILWIKQGRLVPMAEHSP
jgi:ATP-binding cassette subfamily B protein